MQGMDRERYGSVEFRFGLWNHDEIHIGEELKLSASFASSAPDILLSSPDRANKGHSEYQVFCPSSLMASLHVWPGQSI